MPKNDEFFSLNIRTSNAAFKDPDDDERLDYSARYRETARILREVAKDLEGLADRERNDACALKDINGNTIGGWNFN
jgi:hypothetical protein